MRNSTLNGVDFIFAVPPNTEIPFVPNEFWLYARFYSLSDVIGNTPPLKVSCVWHDSPTGKKAKVWMRNLGSVRFSQPHQVMDRAWVFRNSGDEVQYDFPGLGRYEFRLWHTMKKWPGRKVKAREYMKVEVQP
jgi:hypothetical protein